MPVAVNKITVTDSRAQSKWLLFCLGITMSRKNLKTRHGGSHTGQRGRRIKASLDCIVKPCLQKKGKQKVQVVEEK